MKPILSGLALSFAVLLAAMFVLGLTSCEKATLPVAQGYGPNPLLPKPNPTLVPTVNIAPATGWPDGSTPLAAPGLAVNEFAGGLDHPRWLHVLPNGDVLVAESNAPAHPDAKFSLRGFVMGKVMARAGATVPSPNRITLLRDSDGDGVADTRSVFLTGLNSPFSQPLERVALIEIQDSLRD